WFLSGELGDRCSRRGQFASLDGDEAVLDFVRILKKTAFRRTGSARAIPVIRSAMARTHEETRLRKPADRTAQMRAVDGKDLELFSCDTPYPAGRVRCLAIGRHDVRILKRGQARLAFREFTDISQWHPGEISVRATASNRGEKKSYNRYGHDAR